MSHSIANPETLHNPVGYGYSHIARASGETVFVTEQYASDREGHAVSEDFAEQVRQSFANLGKAPAEVGLDHSHVVQIRTQTVDHDQDQDRLEILLKAVHNIWGTCRHSDARRSGRAHPARHAVRGGRRRDHRLGRLSATWRRPPSVHHPREHGVPVFVHAADTVRARTREAQGCGRACASGPAFGFLSPGHAASADAATGLDGCECRARGRPPGPRDRCQTRGTRAPGTGHRT
ncbi:RidA family protein [Nonomuraea sp. NPDC049655]|uniref:RidA family protein n=1 Tax=Nonomuraea sp. NPDC049655 TaxID=3364355 RepID=UPI00379598E5